MTWISTAPSGELVTKHLRVLERAKLIARSREAQRRPCRLAAPLKEVANWAAEFRRGKPWLPKDIRFELELLDERRFASGMVYLQYRCLAQNH